MLRSILFDVAFLGFGGALLISTIDLRGGLVLLAIGILATLTYRAVDASPARRSAGISPAPLGLHAAA
jgi:hypothetical protein